MVKVVPPILESQSIKSDDKEPLLRVYETMSAELVEKTDRGEIVPWQSFLNGVKRPRILLQFEK